MEVIIGYICAIAVGISLGVLGSGGSILTVPIMVYLMHVMPTEAIVYSLFTVGVTSAVGGSSYVRKGLVDWKIAFVFAVPSILSVFVTRKFILKLIPETVSITTVLISRDDLIMILFSVLMIVAGYKMIFPTKLADSGTDDNAPYNYPYLLFVGLVAGFFTGLFGVGGGFIIIPALVLFAKVSIRMSVGTSLLIIAFNSFAGFTEELLQKHSQLDFNFLLKFTAMAVIGIYVGYRISMKLEAIQLKKIFGWFIVTTGIFLFVKEISYFL